MTFSSRMPISLTTGQKTSPSPARKFASVNVVFRVMVVHCLFLRSCPPLSKLQYTFFSLLFLSLRLCVANGEYFLKILNGISSCFLALIIPYHDRPTMINSVFLNLSLYHVHFSSHVRISFFPPPHSPFQSFSRYITHNVHTVLKQSQSAVTFQPPPPTPNPKIKFAQESGERGGEGGRWWGE